MILFGSLYLQVEKSYLRCQIKSLWSSKCNVLFINYENITKWRTKNVHEIPCLYTRFCPNLETCGNRNRKVLNFQFLVAFICALLVNRSDMNWTHHRLNSHLSIIFVRVCFCMLFLCEQKMCSLFYWFTVNWLLVDIHCLWFFFFFALLSILHFHFLSFLLCLQFSHDWAVKPQADSDLLLTHLIIIIIKNYSNDSFTDLAVSGSIQLIWLGWWNAVRNNFTV